MIPAVAPETTCTSYADWMGAHPISTLAISTIGSTGASFATIFTFPETMLITFGSILCYKTLHFANVLENPQVEVLASNERMSPSYAEWIGMHPVTTVALAATGTLGASFTAIVSFPETLLLTLGGVFCYKVLDFTGFLLTNPVEIVESEDIPQDTLATGTNDSDSEYASDDGVLVRLLSRTSSNLTILADDQASNGSSTIGGDGVLVDAPPPAANPGTIVFPVPDQGGFFSGWFG
ncbi:MAG: hypothetical protein KAR79_00790 [Simkaniaceae bacterium]|nr:hypothetical protein [Simkaniaceae bacterium]